MQNNYLLIEDQHALDAQIKAWSEEKVLAIDTEFMRTDSYYAKPGLIQIADSKGVYIIDPLLVKNLKPLAVLLSDANIVKVMHSMSEDIELLYQACGVLAECVFDTQIAAGFLGYGASLGYQSLVSEVLGYPVDKSETRSDWLQRPLTDKQLEYAAKDAEYLILLHKKLEASLLEKKLLAAVLDEAANTLFQTKQSWDQAELAYLKLRGAYELPINKQITLKGLVIWRDNTAQSENVPKPWVFSDKQLIQFAEITPNSFSQLRNNKELKPKSVRLYGEALLQQLSDLANTVKETDSSFIKIDRPVKGDELQLFKKLKTIVAEIAEKTGIATQLLGSRKMLEKAVIVTFREGGTALPLEFNGWRKPLMGERFLAVLKPGTVK